MELFNRFTINAARRLPKLPPEHPCSRVHGHTFLVEVRVGGAVGADSGWVMDFAVIETACARIAQRLDHRYLNDIEGLENPTSEHLCIWIWRHVERDLAGLTTVTVQENQQQGCTYHGPATD